MTAYRKCYQCRFHGTSEFGEDVCHAIGDYPILNCRSFKQKYDDED